MIGELTETIVARATAPGVGSVGIVRISGPQSVAVADAIFTSIDGGGVVGAPPRLMHYGRFSADGREVDSGYCVRFAAPASFTGEDVVELHAHGNPLLLDALVDECVRLGCRRARAGEFSLRAFLNGKLDLVQAEALGELIAAETVEATRIAEGQLGGSLSARYAELRQQVLETLALLELQLDFTEEGYEFVGWERIDDVLRRIRALCVELLRAHEGSAALRRGPRVLLAGRPNAGKSSLFNALLGYSRALVSAHAGTTRDYIEERVPWKGIVLHVIDSAGLRETEEEIESQGVSRALGLVGEVDLVLFLVDACDPSAVLGADTEIRRLAAGPEGVPIVKVMAKADAARVEEGMLACSSRDAASVEALLDVLTSRFADRFRGVHALVSRRQADELAQMVEIVDRVAGMSVRETEVVAEELRQLLGPLSRLSGETVADDVLSAVFESFCIGK